METEAPDKVVERFEIDAAQAPRLWKARQAFLSAIDLHAKSRLDCASNRLYYCVFHILVHLLGEDDPANKAKDHAVLQRAYYSKCGYDHSAAIDLSAGIRKQADYTPHPVKRQAVVTATWAVYSLFCDTARKAGLSGRSAWWRTKWAESVVSVRRSRNVSRR